MKINNDAHLTEDRIIRSVVDKSELLSSEKEHLLNCSGCSSVFEGFENDLKQLGKIAELSVPAPKRRFIAHAKKTERNFPRFFGLRTSLAAAITVLFFVITLHSDSMKSLLNTETRTYVDELYSDDLFITEINSLIENALPHRYTNIYMEAGPDYDDDFMDFIIPSYGDDTISGEGEGGLLS